MSPKQQADESILRGRAFYMHKKCGDLLKELYLLLALSLHKGSHSMLNTVRRWLLAPFSLWPCDFKGGGEYICAELKAGRQIDREMAALLEFAKPIPGKEEQDAVAEYEVHVQAGKYDDLVKDNIKYAARLKELDESKKFHAHLKLLQILFNLDEIAGKSTVLRRMPVCERNFRISEFIFDWRTRKSRFRQVFTVFCWNHELYGLEKKDGKWVPLLMKVTVTVTPHGLIIYVPKWMSLDFKRDLIIRAVTELHKSRGNLRQGPKISGSRLDKQEIAVAVYRADQLAKDRKYKGKKRYEFIIKEARLPAGTDQRRIYELIKQGAEVVAEEKELEAIAAIASLPAARDTEPTALEAALRAFDKLNPEEKDKFLKAAAR